MFLECRRSWSSCRRPERVASRHFQSTLKRRTILLEAGLGILAPLRRTQTVTQKIQRLFEKTAFSANTKLFPHSLGQKRTPVFLLYFTHYWLFQELRMNLKNIITLAVVICMSSTPVFAKKEKDKNKIGRAHV